VGKLISYLKADAAGSVDFARDDHIFVTPARLPALRTDVRISGMKFVALCAVLLLFGTAFAQTPEPSSAPGEMVTLERKIDELNTKIDALSQHILKLEQQTSRPGTMIGETSPSPVPSAPVTPSESAHANETTHVVARGETLTSIAKQHKVGVEELQKFNHIEDGRKLQAGQTIMIPPSSASPAASASPSPTPQ
jgi:LysM repeat protein